VNWALGFCLLIVVEKYVKKNYNYTLKKYFNNNVASVKIGGFRRLIFFIQNKKRNKIDGILCRKRGS